MRQGLIFVAGQIAEALSLTARLRKSRDRWRAYAARLERERDAAAEKYRIVLAATARNVQRRFEAEALLETLRNKATVRELLDAAEEVVTAGMVYTSIRPPPHPGLDALIAAGNRLSSASSAARNAGLPTRCSAFDRKHGARCANEAVSKKSLCTGPHLFPQDCTREQPHAGPCNGWPCAYVRSLRCPATHVFGEDLGTGRASACSLENDAHVRHLTDDGRWWEVHGAFDPNRPSGAV